MAPIKDKQSSNTHTLQRKNTGTAGAVCKGTIGDCLSVSNEQANPSKIKLVMGTWDEPVRADLALPATVKENVMIYPETEDVVVFARKTAKLLLREFIKESNKI